MSDKQTVITLIVMWPLGYFFIYAVDILIHRL